jgi:glycine/D-amino acid oxidase-like deaminating enzyme
MANVAVLGTGSIGSSTAADLVEAGINLVLIDQWPAHVEACGGTVSSSCVPIVSSATQ